MVGLPLEGGDVLEGQVLGISHPPGNRWATARSPVLALDAGTGDDELLPLVGHRDGETVAVLVRVPTSRHIYMRVIEIQSQGAGYGGLGPESDLAHVVGRGEITVTAYLGSGSNFGAQGKARIDRLRGHGAVVVNRRHPAVDGIPACDRCRIVGSIGAGGSVHDGSRAGNPG